MDMNEGIDFLETEILRLNRQKEQEAAMVEVLPVRFERNLDAFRKYIPAIYEQFFDYEPKSKLEFFCNENGIPNLLWGIV